MNFLVGGWFGFFFEWVFVIWFLVVKFVYEVGLYNFVKWFMCVYICVGFGKIYFDFDGFIDKFLFWVIGVYDGWGWGIGGFFC